ncbi:hypothetical protein FQA39_LY17708 [Lamprigera yunnana]|nr:hypothetical protein FQA39_LY17708 [Lamprigera yunnana]
MFEQEVSNKDKGVISRRSGGLIINECTATKVELGTCSKLQASNGIAPFNIVESQSKVIARPLMPQKYCAQNFKALSQHKLLVKCSSLFAVGTKEIIFLEMTCTFYRKYSTGQNDVEAMVTTLRDIEKAARAHRVPVMATGFKKNCVSSRRPVFTKDQESELFGRPGPGISAD